MRFGDYARFMCFVGVLAWIKGRFEGESEHGARPELKREREEQAMKKNKRKANKKKVERGTDRVGTNAGPEMIFRPRTDMPNKSGPRCSVSVRVGRWLDWAPRHEIVNYHFCPSSIKALLSSNWRRFPPT